MSDGERGSFYTLSSEGLRVRIRLTPSGRRDEIGGVMLDAGGLGVLKVSVTKAPEEGKANAALVKFMAKEWRRAKSSIEIIQGQTSRNKTLLINGDAASLQNDIHDWARAKGLA